MKFQKMGAFLTAKGQFVASVQRKRALFTEILGKAFLLWCNSSTSQFGGWLSVQAGGLHRMDSKLFFNLWRNLQ
jgi:hypothetical protein